MQELEARARERKRGEERKTKVRRNSRPWTIAGIKIIFTV